MSDDDKYVQQQKLYLQQAQHTYYNPFQNITTSNTASTYTIFPQTGYSYSHNYNPPEFQLEDFKSKRAIDKLRAYRYLPERSKDAMLDMSGKPFYCKTCGKAWYESKCGLAEAGDDSYTSCVLESEEEALDRASEEVKKRAKEEEAKQFEVDQTHFGDATGGGKSKLLEAAKKLFTGEGSESAKSKKQAKRMEKAKPTSRLDIGGVKYMVLDGYAPIEEKYFDKLDPQVVVMYVEASAKRETEVEQYARALIALAIAIGTAAKELLKESQRKTDIIEGEFTEVHGAQTGDYKQIEYKAA